MARISYVIYESIFRYAIRDLNTYCSYRNQRNFLLFLIAIEKNILPIVNK